MKSKVVSEASATFLPLNSVERNVDPTPKSACICEQRAYLSQDF